MAERATKLGFNGYASLLRTVMDGPITSRDLAAIHGWTVDAVKETFRRWRKQGVIHVCDWRSDGHLKHPAEVWAMGRGVEPPRPLGYRGVPGVRHARIRLDMRSNVFTFGLIMRALEDGHTAIDLSNLIGIHRTTSQRLLVHMRKIGMTHTGAWITPPWGPDVAVHKLGIRNDVSHPRRPDKPARLKARRQASPHHGLAALGRVFGIARPSELR